MANPSPLPPLPPAARLLVCTPEGVRFEHPVEVRCAIGRHPESDLQLGDREVSKEHAVLEPGAEGFELRDLHSSNGTFVNGQRVTRRPLHDGDEIKVGATLLTFRSGRATPAVARTRGGVTLLDGGQLLSNVVASVRGEAAAQFRPAAAIAGDVALRDDYEKLRAALEFQRQLGGESSREVVLSRLLDVAFEMLRADNGAVLSRPEPPSPSATPPPASLPAALEVERVRRGAGQRDDVVVSATLLKRVVESGEGFLTADAVMDQRFVPSKSIVAHGLRSVLAAPLVIKGEVTAVIFLDTRERTAAFTDKDLNILAALAAQAAAAIETASLRQRLQAEERQRENLARFLPPVLVDQVAAGRVKLVDQGELRPMTILFADIRGFTSLAETQPPEEVVQMLKVYFELMAEAVFDHRGIVDKFIGDAVMALWGAPEPLEDAPLRACRAALEMQVKLAAFNGRRLANGEPLLNVGIGINSGPAVVGLMGSSRRPEYTAIGDTVNVASRLCGLAAGGQVLISASTATAVSKELALTALPDAQVKGRAKPVRVFALEVVVPEATLVK